jgi:carboxypeptidase C (cathepsin A)
MNLNGIMLLSSVLNFGSISFDPGNDLPYALFLPTYTAAAWYHNKLPKDLQAAGLQKAIEESRRYAAGPYTTALFKGDIITAEERAAVVKNLARFTGLSPQYIDESNLRVRANRFEKELLLDQRRTLGRYDSRLEGVDEDVTASNPEYDPSYSSVHPTLRDAMTQNASLKVFVGMGYYDLATPFFSQEYTLEHMGLDPKLRDHVTLSYYEAGHMMYTQLKSLQKARQDLSKFMTSCLP